MLLTIGREPFDDLAWVYEPKWDGFRIIAAVQNGAVRLLSRNLHTLTDRFRPVAAALQGFPTSLVLDGEMVVITEKGIPEFEALHRRLRPQRQRPSGLRPAPRASLLTSGSPEMRTVHLTNALAPRP